MFVGKYGAYLIVEQLIGQALGFSYKHWIRTRMERPARDKRSRLLRKFVNDGRIKSPGEFATASFIQASTIRQIW